MPIYGLDDPNLNRHQIALLAAIIRRQGGRIVVTYDELSALGARDQIAVENDLRARQVTLVLHHEVEPVALPPAVVPALEEPQKP